MKIINTCNKIIEYSFYALFLLVPLVFTNDTYELFEFNKMWLTFGLTLVIAASWGVKMIVEKEIRIQRTPLDIPIVLFLLSQIISTIFSLDTHISLWGYYSRFNGSLLSIISYILLYYAFVSNLSYLGDLIVKRLLMISLAAGAIVALWGLPSHFGYDPTCLLFRGTFDVSCWTFAFQPRIRIFSTLGQPDWLAAYLAILLPLVIALALRKTQTAQNIRASENRKSQHTRTSGSSESLIHRYSGLLSILSFLNTRIIWKKTLYFLLLIIFYLDLIYTDARSGFIAFWVAFIFLILAYIWLEKESLFKFKNIHLKFSILNSQFSILLMVLMLIGSITFFVGTPISQLDNFTFANIKEKLSKPSTAPPKPTPPTAPVEKKPNTVVYTEMGGTESWKIRQIVWKGALDIWKHYPIFGTGVETFAFAYYKYRSPEHNLTSEWDYLYNKAHNEYLNYLATTGAFGLGTYMLIIGAFIWLTLINLFQNTQKTRNVRVSDNQSNQHTRTSGSSESLIHRHAGLLSIPSFPIIVALISGYLSILVSNFFGFSVVIINIYFFFIPAFVFILQKMINPEKTLVYCFSKTTSKNNHRVQKSANISANQGTSIAIIISVVLYLLYSLFQAWQADKAYAMGSNLNRAGQYQQAYPYLKNAVELKDSEPIFKDELSSNNASLAVYFASLKNASAAAQLAQEAIRLSDQITTNYQNNIVFWKTRVRMLSALSQVDSRFLPLALESIKKVELLAPTDAKVSYSLGVLYAQNGQGEKAIETLSNTIKLKPNYKDAYYALGLFYHDMAVDNTGRIIKPDLQKKAVETIKFMIDAFPAENNSSIKQILKDWGEN